MLSRFVSIDVQTFATMFLGLALMVPSLHVPAATTEFGSDTTAEVFPPAPMEPDEIIRHGIGRLYAFLEQPGADNPLGTRSYLDQHIAPYFDFEYMAKWAVGPFHRRLSEENRAALTKHLHDTFLTALARNLGSFATPPPRTTIDAARPGRSEHETAVTAHVVLGPSVEITLEFRFYWSPDGWKIFDVAANGSSAVAYYRRYYTEKLRRHGPETFLQ